MPLLMRWTPTTKLMTAGRMRVKQAAYDQFQRSKALRTRLYPRRWSMHLPALFQLFLHHSRKAASPSPEYRSISTAPLIPGTLPDSVYCHSSHESQPLGKANGWASEEYCANHKGC